MTLRMSSSQMWRINTEAPFLNRCSWCCERIVRVDSKNFGLTVERSLFDYKFRGEEHAIVVIVGNIELLDEALIAERVIVVAVEIEEVPSYLHVCRSSLDDKTSKGELQHTLVSRKQCLETSSHLVS